MEGANTIGGSAGVDAIVVGAGLAGLSCAFELAEAGHRPLVLEAQAWTGGRTASWTDPDGMIVESGLHRVIGSYAALSDLLRRAGVDPDEAIIWENEVEFRQPGSGASAVFAAAPLDRPLEMVADLFRHNDYLSPAAKLSFAAFMARGLKDFAAKPERLDEVSVLDYAVRHGVQPEVISRLLEPLMAGIYFVPAGQLSAQVFFALVGPYLPQLPRFRVGAFAGGMTEVMTDPIANAIRRRGGIVLTSAPAHELLLDEADGVAGVRSGTTGYLVQHVVFACSLRATQRLLRSHFAAAAWAQPALSLPTMPAVTLQLELDGPSVPVDRTTFGVGTALACFSEQARTTFRGHDGRLSIILAPSDKLIALPPEKILEIALEDADRLGLRVRGHVRRWRVVRHTDDFYSLAPGHDARRPPQATPVRGLTLAGDFTRQPFVATMEGAVVSGRMAAEIAIAALRGAATR